MEKREHIDEWQSMAIQHQSRVTQVDANRVHDQQTETAGEKKKEKDEHDEMVRCELQPAAQDGAGVDGARPPR